MSDKKNIVLPSLVRRCMKAYAIKALIRQQPVKLERIGRSRNWKLTADFEQLQQIINDIEHADEASWLWVAKLLQEQYQDLSHDALVKIALLNTGITVNELVMKTHCTLAQARQVIDELEWLD